MFDFTCWSFLPCGRGIWNKIVCWWPENYDKSDADTDYVDDEDNAADDYYCELPQEESGKLPLW